MNHDVFISYSHKNMTAAQAICHELEDKGIKCWMAPRDIPVGAKYASVITDAIVNSRIVVLVFSDYSARSPWVESEINIAFSNRKTIIPYKIDKTNYEDFKEFYLMLNNRHWIEAYPDYKTRFKELVTIVAQTLGRNVSASKPAEPRDPAPTSIPTPTPSDPKNLKRYWWVALCVLAVGCAMWYISADEVEQLNYEVVQEKVETEEIKKDNSYLLNLPDSKFERFEENGKYGFKLKTTGEIVIPLKYDFAWSFSRGLAAVRLNGKWGFIDKIGKEDIPFKYDDAFSFREGLAWVKLNGKYGYIDKTGNEIIPFKYDFADNFSEGLAMVELYNKWGFIDVTGKEVVPLKYDVARFFSEGFTAVKLNGKWGYIDKTGKEVIPLKYDFALSFSKGKAKVKLNGEEFYIDKNGNRVK